jgi:hypothetical protein|tara:strand:- start:4446 stop:4943 length:498 start_codon:yes stop_codon:yes gene_type:complete
MYFLEWLYVSIPTLSIMADGAGQDVVEKLGSRDLNNDGEIINLAIVGSSRYYDFESFENIIDSWVGINGYPDLVIVGGASGVDYLAERWATNSSIPIAVFSEEWEDPRRGLQDRGRPEAPNSLTEKILTSCSHILAIPSTTSKWTRVVIMESSKRGIPIQIHEIT